VRLTEKFAGHLGAPIAILHKRRDPTRHNVAETLDVIGDVEGRTAVLIDDMIDTAGTIVGAAALLKERGAERVIACATHPIFSGPAVERLDASVIERVVVTNTIPLPADLHMDKLVVLSIAPILASALRAVFEDESVSEIFRGENV
jgi:ribose-phosphate pyrophosphokinase